MSSCGPVFAGQTFNPFTGKLDKCITVQEEDGLPSNVQCFPVKVPNNSLTDNTGSYSFNPAAASITCADTGVIFADGANNAACDATGLHYDKTTDTLYVGALQTDATDTPEVDLFPEQTSDTHWIFGVNGDGGNDNDDNLIISEGGTLGSSIRMSVTPGGLMTLFANLTIGNGATTAGVLTLLEDTDAGANFASFQVPALAANTVYTLPADDGDADQVLSTNGSGTLDWVAAAAGSGDVTDVGDCATGACFTGASGTLLQSNTDLIMELDNDANGSESFQIKDGANAMVAEIDETGVYNTLIGLDGIGAIDLDYGSADITDHAFITDGTGTAEIVLPAGSIDGTEILDATIGTADISGSAGITAAQTALTAGRSLTLSTNDILADAELYTDTKCIYWENPVATDDFKSIWFSKLASTITSIWAESDQTVTFMLQVDDGSAADVDTVDLAPAAGTAEDTSLDGDATMAAGDRLDMAVTSVANTPTWASVCWTFTRDD